MKISVAAYATVYFMSCHDPAYNLELFISELLLTASHNKAYHNQLWLSQNMSPGQQVS